MNPFSIHLGYVLGALPLADRFARAEALGFRFVETPFPYATAADDYASFLQRHGLRQISIGAPTSDYRKGETGLAVDPAQRNAFTASLEKAAAYATRIGCPAIHVFSGCASPHLSQATMLDTYRANLATAASFLAGYGITTLIEPINSLDFPGYFLNSLDQALAILTEVGSDHIRLIFDIYHVRMMGADPQAALTGAHRHVAHVQFADYPGRHELGTGTLDFAGLVAAMRSVGYAGSAGLEYIPMRAASEPLTLPPAVAEYAGLESVAG